VNRENGAILAKQQSQVMHVASDMVDVPLPQRGFQHVVKPFKNATALEVANAYLSVHRNHLSSNCVKDALNTVH
jgi:hypothetical protein